MGSSKLIITMRIGDDCCYSLYPTLYVPYLGEFRICPSRFVRFYTRSRNLDVCQNFKEFVINIF